MDDANTGYLGDKFRFMKCSIDCGDGWIDIIDNLLEDIEALNIEELRIINISQKLGFLRVLFRVSTEEDFDRVRELIWTAQEKSVKVCEICGNPGKSDSSGGRASTMCDDCRKLEHPFEA